LQAKRKNLQTVPVRTPEGLKTVTILSIISFTIQENGNLFVKLAFSLPAERNKNDVGSR